jgi:hypothetical protein
LIFVPRQIGGQLEELQMLSGLSSRKTNSSWLRRNFDGQELSN